MGLRPASEFDRFSSPRSRPGGGAEAGRGGLGTVFRDKRIKALICKYTGVRGDSNQPADRERIVEPYVTTREKGTGLGLAIVNKIVDEHGGDLSFSAVEGGGKRVTLRVARDALAKTEKERTGQRAHDEIRKREEDTGNQRERVHVALHSLREPAQ